MFLLKLAARNLLRNTRRSVISVAMVALGLALILVTVNFQSGSYNNLLGAAISATAGHVVVQAEGWQDDPEPDKVLTGSGEIAQTLAEAFPTATITRRAFLGGLLTSPTGSVAVSMVGVDPDAEARAATLDEHIVDGAWLGDSSEGIVIGEVLAEQLGVEIGDKLVFMAQVGDAEMVSRLFRVSGVFRTGSADVDGFTVQVPLVAAQELLPGEDPATQVAVHLANARRTPEALAEVRELFPNLRADILDWQHAIPVLREQMQIDQQLSDVIYTLMGCIVAVGVLNTVLMGVMERMREFGVLLAVGMRPRRLSVLVLLEGVVLGIFASLVGLALGLLCSWPLVVWGVDFGDVMKASMSVGGALDPVIHARWDVSRMMTYTAGAAFLTVLATLYPAWKVTKLQPVQALRHT